MVAGIYFMKDLLQFTDDQEDALGIATKMEMVTHKDKNLDDKEATTTVVQ